MPTTPASGRRHDDCRSHAPEVEEIIADDDRVIPSGVTVVAEARGWIAHGSAVRAATESERGAALVEMAVVSSLLMVILLGIITFGLTHHQNISIEGAAREAARFGATYPVDDAGSLAQWLRDVAQVAENATTGALGPGNAGRVVCIAQGSGSDPTAFSRIHVTGSEPIGSAVDEIGWCFENTAPVDDTVVQVHLEMEGWIEGIVFSMKPTLTGEATNRFERDET